MTDIQIARRRDRIIAFIFVDHASIVFFGVIMMFLSLENDYDIFDVDNLMNRKLPLFFILVATYFCKDFYKGISFGKWLMGIAVRDNQDFERIPSRIILLIRNLFIVFWPLEALVLILNPKKQRIGDIVANTRVVRIESAAFNRTKVFALASIFFAGILLLLLSIHLSTVRTSAYKVSIAAIKNNKDLKEKTGGVTGFGWFPTFSGSFGQNTGEVDVSTKVYFANKENIDIVVHLKKQNESKWTITSPSYLIQ